jgi:hypothetical protein
MVYQALRTGSYSTICYCKEWFKFRRIKVHSGTVYSTCMYRQFYPLPTFCFSSAINSKMPKRRKGPVKKAPPSPPKRTAKRKIPLKVPTAAAKKAAVKLKDAPIPVVPARSTTPSPDTKSPAQSSQMSGAAHSVTSVVVPTTRTPNDNNTQEELTMEGGIAATDQSAFVAYTNLDRKTNDQSAVITVIQNYVTQHFFQHVKFITRIKKLAYYNAKTNPKTYWAVTTKGCHLPPGTDPVNWWESVAKREVRKTIHQLRSNRLTALKWDYYGTYE